MAEKIGFVTFHAFDLKKVDEFDSKKWSADDIQNPTDTWFEKHPAIPRWRNPAELGIEPVVRKTPDQLKPLMNEYHRYFLENAVQHEAYARWARRHKAWDREAEIAMARFTKLRDYLNDKYASADYGRRGRVHEILTKAAQKTWLNTEIVNFSALNEAVTRQFESGKALQKALKDQAYFRNTAYSLPEREAFFKDRESESRKVGDGEKDKIPLLIESRMGWVSGLAFKHYLNEIERIPMAPPTVLSNTASTVQTPSSPPIVKKVSGLG